MRSWLRRNSEFIGLLLAAVAAVLVGVYVNVATSGVDVAHPDELVIAMLGLGAWNLLPILSLGLIFLQYRVTRSIERTLRRQADEVIEDILEAASKSLICPYGHRHIRAIVTVRKGNTGTRVTKYCYNTTPDPERTAVFPVDFGVTGEAYRKRAVVMRELAANHVLDYDSQLQPLISADLRTVLAAPILASEDRKDEPLGVLAFDSSLPPASLGFDRPEARDAAQLWADIIAKLLKVREG